MTWEEVNGMVDRMSLDELIKLWNDVVADSEDYMQAIHEMKDDSWWNELFRRNASMCRMMVRDLLYSVDFNIEDRYFFYDDNECYFESFTTKEQLVSNNRDFFVEILVQRSR